MARRDPHKKRLARRRASGGSRAPDEESGPDWEPAHPEWTPSGRPHGEHPPSPGEPARNGDEVGPGPAKAGDPPLEKPLRRAVAPRRLRRVRCRTPEGVDRATRTAASAASGRTSRPARSSPRPSRWRALRAATSPRRSASLDDVAAAVEDARDAAADRVAAPVVRGRAAFAMAFAGGSSGAARVRPGRRRRLRAHERLRRVSCSSSGEQRPLHRGQEIALLLLDVAADVLDEHAGPSARAARRRRRAARSRRARASRSGAPRAREDVAGSARSAGCGSRGRRAAPRSPRGSRARARSDRRAASARARCALARSGGRAAPPPGDPS